MKKCLLVMVSILLSMQIAFGLSIQDIHIYPNNDEITELYISVDFSGTPCNSKILFFFDDIYLNSKNLGCSTQEIESDVFDLRNRGVECGTHEIRVELFQNDERIQKLSRNVSVISVSSTPYRTNISGNNIHCLFCQTLCTEALDNPTHHIIEEVLLDEDSIESNSSIARFSNNSIRYVVNTDYIPLQRLSNNGTYNYVDFEYRGKMILFGDEYYVREIDGTTKIYLSKGKVLDDISSEGYTVGYNDYKFKIDHRIYGGDYVVVGVLLDIEKPNGTVAQTQITETTKGTVDNLEIVGVYAEEADALARASIIVYDTTTDVVLENGEDIILNGEAHDSWEVTLDIVEQPFDFDMNITEYKNISENQKLLSNITIAYTKGLNLSAGESFPLPQGYEIVYDGLNVSIIYVVTTINTTTTTSTTTTSTTTTTTTSSTSTTTTTSSTTTTIAITICSFGCNYTTIQAGVDAAASGDSVYVYNGTYMENVVIDKSSLRLIGENRDATIIDGLWYDPCIRITENNVTVSGFTIKNGGNNVGGIKIESDENNISNNKILDNHNGICIHHNDYNNIQYNNISNNRNYGIYLDQGRYSIVKHNNISCSDGVGILLSYSESNQVSDNLIESNDRGLYIYYESNYNAIINNTLISNWAGIFVLQKSIHNNISTNTITQNSKYGIYLSDGSNYNSIYDNNFINNTIQAHEYQCLNYWDNGSINGGNYWSDHNCTGNPSNGSQPYYINSTVGSTDDYPFQDADGWIAANVTTTTTMATTSSTTIIATTTSTSSTSTTIATTIPCNTNISGILPANETWGEGGSPYCIIGNTIVEEGHNLIIESGADVVFNDTIIYIDGMLNAKGNESERITFKLSETASSGQLLFRGPYASVLDNFIIRDVDLGMEETSGQVNLTNGNLTNSAISLRYMDVYNNEFNNCYFGIYSQSPVTTTTIVTPTTTINPDRGDEVINIINNSFHSGGEVLYIELMGDSPMNFIGNSVYDCDAASVIYVWEAHGLNFSHNTIHDNSAQSVISLEYVYDSTFAYNIVYNNTGEGISGSIGSNTLFEFNTIMNNEIGVYMRLCGDSVFRNNDVYNNSEYDAKIRTSYGTTLNLSNNYWGTTTSSLIDEHIYDYYDDFDLGKIIYEPFLTEPVSEAPSLPITTTTTTTTTSTTTTIPQECETEGDTPPCGEVTISEVIDFINLWVQDQANLGAVIELINLWSS